MCCFSRSVRHVSKTRIYARPVVGKDADQLLVYSMMLAADEDVAMVLPIPVPPGSADDAVRFVDMSKCPTFFVEVDNLFPVEVSRGGFAPQALAPRPATLVVHDVGDFEASFVPTRKDFERLDERFRLPDNVFDSLPQYADWGFCVFKLAARKAAGGVDPDPGIVERIKSVFRSSDDGGGNVKDYHPMAFEFPRRDPSRLFFPTVHVHDGEVHEKATFDHQLYCQRSPGPRGAEWERTDTPVMASAGGGGSARAWLIEDEHVYRRKLSGKLPNEDVLI